jgi:hypothetical protein
MNNFVKSGLPLAFVLAMAADIASGNGSGTGVKSFAPGSLGPLLDRTAGPAGAAGDSSQSTVPYDRTTQWFNFRNCFTGYWRNC